MSWERFLEASVGNWAGANTLVRSWLADPRATSDSALTVRPIIRGRFAQVFYDWSVDGKAHEGMMLIGHDAKSARITGGWGDSWHQDASVLQCEGLLEEVRLFMQGSYPAPEGPPWSWRIGISFAVEGELILTMHNISPEGVEELAVEGIYRRI